MASNWKQLLSFQFTKIKLSSPLAFYGKDTVEISTVHHWLRNSRDSGPEWPVRIWKACHRNSKTEQQKVDKVIHENWEIHHTATVEKLNNGLTNVNKNTGLGCKNILWLNGCCNNFYPHEDSQTGSMPTIVCSLWKWQQWFFVQQCCIW